MSLLSKVNLLQGTWSTRDFSRGNTLPLIARPWAMHHWTLQTGRTPWTFNPEHPKLEGIRLTHQPSPWMRDYGNITVTAFNGPIQERIEHQASVYELRRAKLSPTGVAVSLLRYGITIEQAPTERGAVYRFTRLGAEQLKVRFYFDGEHSLSGAAGKRLCSGVSRNNFGGVPEGFGLHFVGEFSESPEDIIQLANGCVFIFHASVTMVELRLAGSFLDEGIALATLRRELQSRSLEDVEAESAGIWENLLNRIAITAADPDTERTFYSCLYRCLLFPRFLDEKDEEGQTVHYSPYDGLRHSGSLCADSGFWDTFRTVYPLLGLAYPEKLSEILRGWLNACRQSGWTPKWPSPGLRDCMIGTHFDAVAADAIARGVIDWNVEEAFCYLWRDATEESSDGRYGRQGLGDYIRLGYVPDEKYPYAVSSTLDYAYDDFCVGQVARFLSKEKEANLLFERSQNYRNVFDSSVGFMRGRLSNGDWQLPFREFCWGGSYIEGGPWQHTFNVPHDPAGLAALFGGSEKLCGKIDAMLKSPPTFESGHYGYEIHEMTEMALAGFGQYAHSNQPVHAFLYLYALNGKPERALHWVRRVLTELYSVDHFPGDEDNGEMAAWYVLSSLGMYPECPGKPGWIRVPASVTTAKINGFSLF